MIRISPAVLLTLRVNAGTVVNQSRKYYKKITETVLRWYTELEDGIIQSDSGPVFDARILDYRLDVEAVMGGFDEREALAVLLVHRDGCTHAEAVRLAGLPCDRPDLTIRDIEVRMGKIFERRKLSQFLEYVNYLR